jgi:hypothetical protein
MALFIAGKSECELCGQVIAKGEDVVGTPHFIPDPSDPLWRFSDAPLHKKCFDAWEHRDEFLARYESVCRGQREAK